MPAGIVAMKSYSRLSRCREYIGELHRHGVQTYGDDTDDCSLL